MKVNPYRLWTLIVSILLLGSIGGSCAYTIHYQQSLSEEKNLHTGGAEVFIPIQIPKIVPKRPDLGRPALCPVEYSESRQITSEFGKRESVIRGYGYSVHTGIDIACPDLFHAEIYASGTGTITDAGYSALWGYYVSIEHLYTDNVHGIPLQVQYETFYAHLSAVYVQTGQTISAGETIGRMGNTGEWSKGDHLHYAVKKWGVFINPLRVMNHGYIASDGRF